MSSAYAALVLDIDGTLLNEQELLPARTAQVIARARAAGVVVMLATGRSHEGAREVAAQLQLDTPCVVFNGAAVYDPQQGQLIEQYWLPAEAVGALLDFTHAEALLPVVSRPEAQLARTPQAHEADMLGGFRNLQLVPFEALPRARALRVTVFSKRHSDSAALHTDVVRMMADRPAYYTHFGLAALAGFRDSDAQVVDVQPACQGKAEALRVLAERHGIDAKRVVAVGDAGNDIPICRLLAPESRWATAHRRPSKRPSA